MISLSSQVGTIRVAMRGTSPTVREGFTQGPEPSLTVGQRPGGKHRSLRLHAPTRLMYTWILSKHIKRLGSCYESFLNCFTNSLPAFA